MAATTSKNNFNIDLLVLSKEQLKRLTPVTKLNIFESSSNNFEPEGLFSTEIFGEVGSTERNTTFSYLELRVKILHPLIYQHITTTRKFYKDVMAGKAYAVFDKKLKDIVPSNEQDGNTGYHYFISVMKDIKLEDKDSDIRKFKIYMIKKYGTEDFLLKEFLILPAGLRDYTINKSGRPEEDEINDKYRKLLTLSNSLLNINVTPSTISAVDNIRYRIQEAILDLYDHIMGLLDGKRKFIQGKWGARGIMYGTRNVITPSLARIDDIDDTDSSVGIEYSTVGLYQYAKGIAPITMNKVHTMFIGRLFSPDNNTAYLYNGKTGKTELTEVKVKERDKWLTLDGLGGVLDHMGQDDLRSEPVKVANKYMLALHDDGKVITPIFNTDMMDESLDKKKLRPITYYELFYIALIDTFEKYRGLVTRYPVINLGGIYPSKVYVKTTNNPRKVDIHIGGRVLKSNDYPNYDEAYYNSFSPHYAYIEGLGADYDGDFRLC